MRRDAAASLSVRPLRQGYAVAGVALCAAASVAVVGTIGGDARWLAALGAAIVRESRIPAGVPFAVAPTHGWHDPLALAALLFHGLYAVDGDRALALAQMAAVAFGFLVLGRDAKRAGASDSSAALALAAVLVGAFPAIAIVRLQLFSFALFPVLLALLRSEHRSPSRRVLLLVPLLALWSNLHAGVLVGLLLALLYLLLDRRRVVGTAPAVALSAACVAACFANSAFLGTPQYFAHILTNEAALQHIGLWRRFSFHAPDDIALLVAAVALALAARRRMPPLWELVALVALAISAANAPRGGIWLLAMLVAPAAAGYDLVPRRRLELALFAVAVTAGVFGIAAWRDPPERSVVEAAVARAHGRPILADGTLAEEVAVRGGRIWVGNPLDAFTRRDQRVYVAWLRGKQKGDRAFRYSRLVLVRPDSAAGRRVARLAGARSVLSSSGGVLYVLGR